MLFPFLQYASWSVGEACVSFQMWCGVEGINVRTERNKKCSAKHEFVGKLS